MCLAIRVSKLFSVLSKKSITSSAAIPTYHISLVGFFFFHWEFDPHDIFLARTKYQLETYRRQCVFAFDNKAWCFLSALSNNLGDEFGPESVGFVWLGGYIRGWKRLLLVI